DVRGLGAADQRLHGRHAAFLDQVVERVVRRGRHIGRLGLLERRAQAIEVLVQRVASPPGGADDGGRRFHGGGGRRRDGRADAFEGRVQALEVLVERQIRFEHRRRFLGRSDGGQRCRRGGGVCHRLRFRPGRQALHRPRNAGGG